MEKQKNKFGETIVPPICQLSRDESHQNFAAALNSPAESLISDYQVKEQKSPKFGMHYSSANSLRKFEKLDANETNIFSGFSCKA